MQGWFKKADDKKSTPQNRPQPNPPMDFRCFMFRDGRVGLRPRLYFSKYSCPYPYPVWGPERPVWGPERPKSWSGSGSRVRGRPEAKILIFSKSLQEPLGGSGDPPGAAGGCRELPGASGGCRGLPGAKSGSGKVPEKIESGLNHHLRQQLAALSGWKCSPGSPGLLDP